jgi:hypothetical protein
MAFMVMLFARFSVVLVAGRGGEMKAENGLFLLDLRAADG